MKAKTIKIYTRRASVYLVGRQVFTLDKWDVVPLAVILVFFTMPFVHVYIKFNRDKYILFLTNFNREFIKEYIISSSANEKSLDKIEGKDNKDLHNKGIRIPGSRTGIHS